MSGWYVGASVAAGMAVRTGPGMLARAVLLGGGETAGAADVGVGVRCPGGSGRGGTGLDGGAGIVGGTGLGGGAGGSVEAGVP
ncbi:hypothetical protein GCM10025331_39870 [Actinoplanes utahensis]|nr:hypothetical protein Aut01nite_78200 [Actinoplanes utahensis]